MGAAFGFGAGSAEAELPADDAEVPATVLCVACGRSDCVGCAAEVSARIGRTPWESADLPLWKRLWHTARLATIEGETFFGTLEDGSVGAALGFALSCEFLAIASLAISWCPLVYLLVPGFVESILVDAERRALVLAALVCSVPVLSILMVLLHVLWAGGLEFGLRVGGAPARLAHCVRYALYSCGWDLVTSPFGFAAGWLSSGFAAAAGELRAAVRIPRFATVAYIGRARRIPETRARRALFIAAVLTGAVVLAGASVMGVTVVMLFM